MKIWGLVRLQGENRSRKKMQLEFEKNPNGEEVKRLEKAGLSKELEGNPSPKKKLAKKINKYPFIKRGFIISRFP